MSWETATPIKVILRIFPAIVFVVGCIVAIAFAEADKKIDVEQAQAILERQALFVEIQFSDRISTYRQLLRTGEGLMAHAPLVTPDEWHRFIGGLNLGVAHPGIERVSIVKYVKGGERDAFIKEQKGRIPDFDITPAGERPDYLVNTLVESLGNPRDVVGLDIGTSQSRRFTVEMARDSGDAALTPPVPIPGTGRDESGVLSYVYYSAFYKGGEVPATVEDRRAALIGWVGVSFSIDQFMKDIISKYPDLDIEVRDIPSTGEQTVIFDSDMGSETGATDRKAPLFHHTSMVSFGGRHWELTVSSTPTLEKQMVNNGPWEVLAGGAFSALLLAAIVELLMRGRQRAHALAEVMTRAHRESEERYRGLISAQSDMVIRVTTDGILTFINDNVAETLGMPPEHLIGTSWYASFDPEDVPNAAEEVGMVASGGQSRFLVFSRVNTTAGSRWYAWDGCGIAGDGGAIAEIQATGRDVNSLVVHEAELEAALAAAEQAGAKLLASNIQILAILSKIIALRDSDTFHHNMRVMIYSYYLGWRMGLGADGMRDLIKGALLHDIGKIGISDNILLKRGRLTPEEFETIKTHVTIGRDFVKGAVWLEGGMDVILYHHEKYDGSGYGAGLAGEEIPILARIFAIADVFDALTCSRPYKTPMPFDEAMAIMRRDTGSHFDPAIMARFTGLVKGLFERIGDRNDESVERHATEILNRHFR